MTSGDWTLAGLTACLTIESPLVSKIKQSMKKKQAKEKASSCDEASVVFALI
jgi:hypothetical protein